MSLRPYYDIDRPFEKMERDIRDFRDRIWSNSSFHSKLVPRDYYSPLDYYKTWEPFRNWDTLKHWDPFKDWSHRYWDDWWGLRGPTSSLYDLPLAGVSSDANKFQVNVDVQHFAPEEIRVKVQDQDVLIEGQHDDKRDDHGYVRRRFMRRYTLPAGCRPETVQSNLSSDGVLTVTAPRALPLPAPGERLVPLAHTGPMHKRITFGK